MQNQIKVFVSIITDKHRPVERGFLEVEHTNPHLDNRNSAPERSPGNHAERDHPQTEEKELQRHFRRLGQLLPPRQTTFRVRILHPQGHWRSITWGHLFQVYQEDPLWSAGGQLEFPRRNHAQVEVKEKNQNQGLDAHTRAIVKVWRFQSRPWLKQERNQTKVKNHRVSHRESSTLEKIIHRIPELNWKHDPLRAWSRRPGDRSDKKDPGRLLASNKKRKKTRLQFPQKQERKNRRASKLRSVEKVEVNKVKIIKKMIPNSFISFSLSLLSLNPMGQELILASLRMLFCHWNMLFILMICSRTKLSSWSLWLIRLIRLFLLNLSLSSRTIRTVPFKLFLLFSSFTILFFKVWYFLINTTWGIDSSVWDSMFCWIIYTGSLLRTLKRYGREGYWWV